MVKLLAVVAVVGSSLMAEAQISGSLKLRLKNELQGVANILEANYAPLEWKQKHLGLNLEGELNKAKGIVDEAKSVREYRQAVVGLLNSTADYHVSFSFAASERAVLPFSVKTVEGKTLIVYIDREKLSEKAFPAQLGDELVQMNGKSIAEEKAAMRSVVGQNVPETDEALLDLYLTRRSARGNNIVPKGTVMVTTRSAQTNELRTTQLFWDRTPESIPGFEYTLPKNSSKIKIPQMKASKIIDDYSASENLFGIGVKKSFLPDLGTRIWSAEDDNTFDAYIYQNAEGKKIGVVRISSYTPESDNLAVHHFKDIIKKFQEETDALVIDQLNNPGGSVFYLYALASHLTDKPLITPRHRFKLSPELVKENLEMLKMLEPIKDEASAETELGMTLGGYPVTYQLVVAVRAYAQFVVDEWKARNYLTAPTWIFGVDAINPSNDVNYTKPIMVLVNELDFSGGDFFPAILQDNKRATIVGTRTAGAGGYVTQVTMPNSFGLESFSYTASIAERIDKQPIENLGVVPDVQLKFSVNDLRNGFQDYLKQVEKLLKDKLQ